MDQIVYVVVSNDMYFQFFGVYETREDAEEAISRDEFPDCYAIREVVAGDLNEAPHD